MGVKRINVLVMLIKTMLVLCVNGNVHKLCLGLLTSHAGKFWVTCELNQIKLLTEDDSNVFQRL